VPVVVAAGEPLIGMEDPVLEMYFMQRGTAAVLNRNSEVLRMLHAGSPIGHISFSTACKGHIIT
jgi:signal-transduction protein with cAMP-binding, CBS, and nucleotidyltransferase domain